MKQKQLGIVVGVGCRHRGSKGFRYRPIRAGSVQLLIPEDEAEAFIAQQQASNPTYEFKVILRAIIARGKRS